jgi:hypothetical protein
MRVFLDMVTAVVRSRWPSIRGHGHRPGWRSGGCSPSAPMRQTEGLHEGGFPVHRIRKAKMKQKSGPDKAPAEQVLKAFGVRRDGSPRLKRTSALCWKDCAARRTSRNFAAGKTSPPQCITADPRSSLRPASAGRAARPAPRRPAR